MILLLTLTVLLCLISLDVAGRMSSVFIDSDCRLCRLLHRRAFDKMITVMMRAKAAIPPQCTISCCCCWYHDSKHATVHCCYTHQLITVHPFKNSQLIQQMPSLILTYKSHHQSNNRILARSIGWLMVQLTN